MESQPLKICSKCHIAQPLDDFPADKDTKDGKFSWCKSCVKAANALRPLQDKIVPEGKICRKCQQLKPIDAFGKDKYTSDGYATRCIECKRAESATYRGENRQKVRKATARWRAQNLDKVQAYEETHKDEKSQRMHKRYEQRKDEILAVNKTWYEANPGYSAERSKRRKAREAELPNTFTDVQEDFMFRYWNDTCVACGTERSLLTLITADHFIPVFAANCPGTIVTNMIPLCLSCNKSKGHSDPHLWLTRRFGQAEAIRIAQAVAAYFTLVAQTFAPHKETV